MQRDRCYFKTSGDKFDVWHIIPDGAWETLYGTYHFVLKKTFIDSR